MYDLSGDLRVILTAIWWLQRLWKEWQNKQAAQKFDVQRFNLGKLS
jgi:hypothetical protein